MTIRRYLRLLPVVPSVLLLLLFLSLPLRSADPTLTMS